VKTRIAAIAAAIALTMLMTGCAAARIVLENVQQDSSAAQSAEASTPTPEATESDAPLIAGSPAPPVAAENAEDAFLIEVRSRLAKIRSQIPDATDEQLLDSAHEACERIEGGESSAEMSLIEGETQTGGYFMDSGAIITSARLTMCPPTE
jgi:hypothetical protein